MLTPEGNGRWSDAPTDDALERMVEESCRRLAERYRQGGPGFACLTRSYGAEKAAELEAIADSIRATRAEQ